MASGNVGPTRRPAGEDAHQRQAERGNHPRGYPRPGSLVEAVCDSSLTLTQTYQDVSGCSVTINKPGRYLVAASVTLQVDTAGPGVLDVQLAVDGSPKTPLAVFQTDDTERVTAFQHWVVDVTTVPSTVKLQAQKANAGGVASVRVGDTVLMVSSGLGGSGVVGGSGGANHDILSATHPDTLAAAVVRGDIAIGNLTPKWARLALGAAATYLRSDGTDLLYSAIPDADIPASIARDAEVTTDIATHAALAAVHHAKYTDADALAAAKAGMLETINFIIDGGGSVPGTGLKGFIHLPFAFTINQVVLSGDKASGSCVVDIWKCTYTQYDITTHPVDADSITAAAVPTITTAAKSKDSTLTGWTTAVAVDDMLAYNLDSVATFTQILVSLKVTRT